MGIWHSKGKAPILPEGMVCFSRKNKPWKEISFFLTRCYLVEKWPLQLWQAWDHKYKDSANYWGWQRGKGVEPSSSMASLSPVTNWSVGQWGNTHMWQLGHREGLKFRWRRQTYEEIGDDAIGGLWAQKCHSPVVRQGDAVSEALF